MMALTVILILSFSLIGCDGPDDVDENNVLYFSDYQQAPNDVNAIKGDNYQTIDFSKDSPIQIVKKAIDNSNGARRAARMVITNSTISSEPDKGLDELRQIVQRSTYMNAHNAKGTYTQIISGMLKLETNSDALNSIVNTIIGSFGYCTRSCDIDGVSYNSSGKSPKFTAAGDKVTRPGGASAKWNKWETASKSGVGGFVDEMARKTNLRSDERLTNDQINQLLADYKAGKYEVVQDDSGEYRVVDPITGQPAGAINTVAPFNGKDFSQATYIRTGDQYQMDDSVIDINKSSIAYKKSEGYYEVKLVYKKGKSVAPDYYDSIIDQSCRVAAGMLIADTNNTPLKIGRLRYTDLTVVTQVWNSGFIKSLLREEELQVVADFNVVVKKGTGLGKSVNNATEIYSYSEKDTDIEFLKEGKEFTEYGK